MSIAVLGAAVVGLPSFAAAAANTVVVTNKDVARQAENTLPTKNWVIYTRNAATGIFRDGPTQPPLNIGSLELTTPTGSDKITAYNYDHVGNKLSDVNAMAYSTFRSQGSTQQVAAINMEVDINGSAPGGYTTLVFEPVYNFNQAAVESNKWQSWDAYKGGQATWWSSRPINVAPNRDTFVSWNTIVAANPDAVILGGYGVNQGSSNPALTTAVDALKIGIANNSTTYDFEKTPVKALTKEDCKNGGFQDFQANYKNQGACVSSVMSNTDQKKEDN